MMASTWIVGKGDTPQAAIADRDAQVDAAEQEYQQHCEAMGLLIVLVTVCGETEPQAIDGTWVAACNVHT